MRREPLRVETGLFLPYRNLLFKVSEFRQEDRRLHLVEPAVLSHIPVHVPGRLAVISQRFRLARDLGRIGEYHAPFSEPAEGLCGKKGGGARVAQGGGALALSQGAEGLGAVLDDEEAVLFCQP